MLEIKNLQVNVENDKVIIQDLNLTVNPGEVHAIMGPNGSGKSTLGYVLAGRDGYEVTQGSVQYQEENLITLKPHERAAKGIFLAFQYPVVIPGINNMYFLRTSLNAIRRYHQQKPIEPMQFLTLVREKLDLLGLSEDFLSRGVNEGFSGGEKKRNEILQLLLLEPRLAILDEIDSGLDIDALQMVAKAVQLFRNEHRSLIIVTHYPRLLEHVIPDYTHVFMQGRIIESGGASLARHLEEKGYAWLEKKVKSA